MEVHGSLTDEGRVQWGWEAVLQAHGSHEHATAAEQVTAPQLRGRRSAEGECFSDAQPCQLTLGHLMLRLTCNYRPPCAAAQHLHPSLPVPEEPRADVHSRRCQLEPGPYREGCRTCSSSPARSNTRQEGDTHQQQQPRACPAVIY